MKKVLVSIALSILTITACGPQPQATDLPSDINEQPTQINADLTPAQRATITTLSQNLGLTAGKIKLVSTEAVDWPDGCLGVMEADIACAQVITPGFRIILDANGREVEYRTNQDGTHIQPATTLMTWKREGGIAGFCDFMTVYLSGEIHGSSCNQGQSVEGRMVDVLSKEEITQLEKWITDYGNLNIDASDPKGVSDRMVVTMTFTGIGNRETVSVPDKQKLLEFARSLHQKLVQTPPTSLRCSQTCWGYS